MLIERVEELIEDEYLKVQDDLEDTWVAKLRDVLSADVKTLRTHVEFEVREQGQRIARLTNQRKKLLEAHYADAIPFDLFREEQARITQELADAEKRLAAVRKAPENSLRYMLDALVDMVRSCHQSYLTANPMVRRLFNQAFFERLRSTRTARRCLESDWLRR